jgi:hypothetical protein
LSQVLYWDWIWESPAVVRLRLVFIPFWACSKPSWQCYFLTLQVLLFPYHWELFPWKQT